ncbi:origin recognition complex subunit 2 [Tricholoma matsutake]|nr:origin recognition complex subunit 2 [Tricholoma matsutake 945]
MHRRLLKATLQDSDLSSDESDGQYAISEEESGLDGGVQTTFDAYFTQSSARAQTSTNVFSSLVPPLTTDEYAAAVASALTRPGLKPMQPSLLSEPSRDLLFSRFLQEMAEGFNLLLYGFGSKRRVLNHFATDYCSKAGYAVVANGFKPDFTMKDFLTSIENVPGISSLGASSTTESQANRIYDFFAESTQRHLYIIIHNIDAPPLRSAKAKSCLSLLALNPRIHIVASIDHINAPLLWSSSEVSARKQEVPMSRSVHPRGFAWLWHDLTTLASYDFELAYADRSSISGAHGGGARRKNNLSAQNAAAMTETAALHILASVTQKAQKLFVLMGTKQLESIGEAGDTTSSDLQQFAIGYDFLFTTARDNFIASNDTALRSLLGEFRDHSLVVAGQATSGGVEVLWIPLRKERLANVLRSLQADS